MTESRPTLGITIKNISGMTIPPRSVVVVTSLVLDTTNYPEGRMIHQATQYNGQAGNIFVTGPQSIKASNRGTAYSDQFIYVAIPSSAKPAYGGSSSSSPSGSSSSSSSSGSSVFTGPSPGDVWGPVPGQWTLGPNGTGFLCQGFANNSGSYNRAMFYRTYRHWYYGMTTSAVTSGSFLAPTTATVDVYIENIAVSSTAPPLVRTTNTNMQGVTVLNYFPGFTAPSGTQCQIEQKISGIWTFKSSDCTGS